MAAIAATQWGVLDVHELRACGLSDDAIARRRRRGLLHRVFPGVYAVNAPPLSMNARFLAATKAASGVLSHYSAATLWRLVDYEPDSPVHVTVTTRGTRRIAGLVVHRTRRPMAVRRMDGTPVTSPARALVDLSAIQSPKTLRRAVREGFALRRVTLEELRGRTRRLDEALGHGYVPTQSELEDAVHDLICAHFERPLVQPTLILDGIATRPDFRWPALRLCVEADGAQYHEHAIARQDDARKQARLEAHGDRVLRVSWEQAISRPAETIVRLRAAGAPAV